MPSSCNQFVTLRHDWPAATLSKINFAIPTRVYFVPGISRVSGHGWSPLMHLPLVVNFLTFRPVAKRSRTAAEATLVGLAVQTGPCARPNAVPDVLRHVREDADPQLPLGAVVKIAFINGVKQPDAHLPELSMDSFRVDGVASQTVYELDH